MLEQRKLKDLRQWKLQDAKNHLSEVVELAINDGPQEITKYGEHAAVILSYNHYQELSAPKSSLVEFFKNSPFYGIELDLERRKDLPRGF